MRQLITRACALQLDALPRKGGAPINWRSASKPVLLYRDRARWLHFEFTCDTPCYQSAMNFIKARLISLKKGVCRRLSKKRTKVLRKAAAITRRVSSSMRKLMTIRHLRMTISEFHCHIHNFAIRKPYISSGRRQSATSCCDNPSTHGERQREQK